MLVAFSVSPNTGDADGGVSEAVARAVRVVRESGLPNSTNAMFTNVEGSWDEVMDVVRRAVEAAGVGSTRVGLVLKADIRPGYDHGQLEAKVERVETRLAADSQAAE
ncbi:MAG TPA: thiamine-binding protein [Pseudonocardiaceae bacterium]|nr:thiamine-binding protein [Pseudonocardiaceae bacterium]